MPRPIYEIAAEIRQLWKPVNYAAVPYLEAMGSLNTIEDMYYEDTAKSIVTYFLCNATSLKGEDARRIKLELKAIAGIK